MEYRWAERSLGRLPALAGELAEAKVEVIVTHGSAGSRAAELGIDRELRACDLVKLRVREVCHGDRLAARARVLQQ